MRRLFILLILFAAAAEARSVLVSDFNGSTVFSQGNSTYRIMFTEQLRGDDTFTIYIVENLSAIGEHEQLLAAAVAEEARLEEENRNMLLLTSDAISLKRADETALETLKKQQDYYGDVLVSLEAQRKDAEGRLQELASKQQRLATRGEELEQKLAGNVVLSPTNYGIGLLVFIMLIAGAIALQRKDLVFWKDGLKGLRKSRHKGEVPLRPGPKKDEAE